MYLWCVLRRKLLDMRNYLIITFLFSIVQVFGQSNTPPAVENTNSTNSNSLNIAVPAAPTNADLDTVLLQESDEKMQIESTSKKMKVDTKRSKSLEDIPANREELTVGASSQVQTQSAVQTFSTSKAQSTQNRTQRTPSVQYQQQMDQAVDYLEQSAPESFEYHFFSYQAGNYNIELVDHLNQAELLRPNNSDVQIQKTAYHIIQGEGKEAISYLDKLIASKRLSDEALNYSEDLVLSVPKSGTLITHGFDDTYGAYYQQLTKGTDSDFMIISLDFLQSEKYQLKLKEFGYFLPKSSVIDVAYLTEFCALNVAKNLTISMTVPKEYLIGISNKLYVTGLVFEYQNDSEYNNFSRNDELWNEVLKKKAIDKFVTDKGRQLSANYLPMLLHLSKVYGELNEPKKKQQVDTVIDKIAIQSNKYEQVKQLKKSF